MGLLSAEVVTLLACVLVFHDARLTHWCHRFDLLGSPFDSLSFVLLFKRYPVVMVKCLVVLVDL
uniref:Secreted protein n=1 Tax=Arundo donax TaxID=35708 RepID=A0A0A9BVP6_ARUDO